MLYYLYRCMITGLEEISYGNIPWALRASVTCDGPYAYIPMQAYTYTLSGLQTVFFDNISSVNGYYYPILKYSPTNGGDFSIQNNTDGERLFAMTGLPAAAQVITINNDTGVITNSADLNLYPYFNNHFFRLKRGQNELVLTGAGTLEIQCEFPVNVGG